MVVLFSLGFCVWEYLASPIFNHFGWTYWIYSFVAESVSLILAGLVIARWFLPRAHEAAPAAPAPEAEATEG
jgi:amino acid permease